MSTDEKQRRRISRREFIKGTAAGAAGAMAAGLMTGCTQSAPAAPEGSSSAATSWLPESWDIETDVVVIGTGCAGLSAACAAAENGAEVLLLEKLPTIGGNSRVSGGNYGKYCTGVDDAEKGVMEEDPDWFVGDSADLYYQEKLKMGGYRSVPEVTRAFADDSPIGYEFLQRCGFIHSTVAYYSSFTPFLAPDSLKGGYFYGRYNAAYDEDGSYIGPFTKGRHHRGGTYQTYSGGEAAVFAIADEAERLGVELKLEMQVTQIYREQPLSGEVVGIKATDLADNTEVTIRAKKGVIVATGGSHANLDWVKKNDPRHTVTRVNSGSASQGATTDGGKPGRAATDASGRGATGEVRVAAQDIGADTQLEGEIQLRWDQSTIAYTGPESIILTNSRGKYIDVDGNGNRFWDEYAKAQTYQARLTHVYENNISTKMGEHTWWGITDGGVVTEAAAMTALEVGHAVKADTLEELAALMDVPADNLVATVNRYNELVDMGEDLDFGQLQAYLTNKIETPPFYAFNKCYYRQADQGGLRINATFQVIDRRGEVIPRLYAAGEVEGCTHGFERDGGCGWTQGIVGGLRAGKHAAGLTSLG